MIALVALSAPLYSISAQGPRAFTPADWYRVTTLSAPALSPDGRLVAFTVTTVKEADNKRHQEVWVAPTAGGASTRYTAPGYESSNPRWSPDGRWLLFNSTRPGSRGRTWGLRMDQPGGEAVEIDSFPTGAAPDNKRFVVTAEPVPADTTKRPADTWNGMPPMARPPFGSITQPLDAKRFDGRHVVDIRYKANGQGFLPGAREARVIRPSQLWIQATDGSPKRIIDTTRYSRRSPAVSPTASGLPTSPIPKCGLTRRAAHRRFHCGAAIRRQARRSTAQRRGHLHRRRERWHSTPPDESGRW
jgi:hypothetical protein